MTRCCFVVSDDHGASMSMPWFSATASSIRVKYWVWAVRHGAMAPSFSDMSGSGMTSSGSISNVVPSPSHVGQAPYGELKEKFLGAGSSKLRPSTGHTRCWLNVMVSFSDESPSRATSSTSATPSASLSAVSSESVSRRSMPSRSTRRSMTTSILCCS